MMHLPLNNGYKTRRAGHGLLVWNGIVTLMALVSTAVSTAYSQSLSEQYQSNSPPVVGGLPPGSKGLQQPVYVADRSVPRGAYSSLSGQQDLSEYLDERVGLVPSNAPPLDLNRFAAGELIAIVGKEPILIGHLIDPKKVTEERMNTPSFEKDLRKALAEVIMRKALAQRFVNDQVSGKSVKEREEGEKHIRRKVTQIFYDSIVPDMKKKQKCETDEEFYAFLEKAQMTLQTLQNDYAETMLARQCINENVPEKPAAELIDLAEYYDEHIDEFKQPAKARFQILTAEFSKHPSKEAAFGAIAEMGNQVIGGRPFETVARSMSNGYAASEGGYYDWTTKSALKSKVIDDVVFSIEPQKLSQIIEDTDGFHIVRVIERKNAQTVPFHEVQPEIKKKIVEIKKKQLEKDYMQKVRETTPVWTRWPEDFPGAMPISDVIGQ
ncbi:MAG: peptidylprolyl isomerase [Pirellula sp.]|jgi:parvulin-like peptidyl-prolyl isomerase